MPDTPDRALRHLFDVAAERYDRIRPGYPPALWDDVAAFGSLGRGSAVLEIGCGTGQATRDLAARGYRVVALEIGPSLAERARRNLADEPDVTVVTTDFERWTPDRPFDAVVAATSFHWLDPETRITRAAAAVRPGGTLALVATDHVAGGTRSFFADAQDCYRRFHRETTPGFRLPEAADVVTDVTEIERTGRFGPVDVRRYESETAYSAAEYGDLLLTYSDVLALEPDAQAAFIGCIRGLIDDRYGGRIVKRYVRTLRLARRTA